MKYEVCVDSIEGVLVAEKCGVDSVELVDNFLEGGTTPSIGSITLAKELSNIDIHVMIRPRGGISYYSDIEFDTMLFDVTECKKIGVAGIVTGFILPDGNLDLIKTKRIIEEAFPLAVTFHRAFDQCLTPKIALEELITTGVSRILTAGQKNQVIEGLDQIKELVDQARGRISIMAGGGLIPDHLVEVVNKTGITECHFAARKKMDIKMTKTVGLKNQNGHIYHDEYWKTITDEEFVKKMMEVLDP